MLAAALLSDHVASNTDVNMKHVQHLVHPKQVQLLSSTPAEAREELMTSCDCRGSTVFVVGEWAGDTATSAFTAALLAGFSLVERLPLPNWSDSAHELTVWQRAVKQSRKQKLKGVQGSNKVRPAEPLDTAWAWASSAADTSS